MAWLSRNDFLASDFLHADDLNNLANDIRTWGGDVNGGNHVLSNVTLTNVNIASPSSPVASVFGRVGAVVAQGGDYASFYLPVSRQVLTGAGLSGGGPLTSDLTLTAAVVSVFNRTGAVVLTPADITGATGVLQSRNIIAGTGLTGTGNLGADVTLAVVPDSTNQQVQLLSAGVLQGTRHAINFIAGANVTLTVADNGGSNRVDVTISASGGNTGMADPTTTFGDLIARGPTVTGRLPIGSNNQVLTVDLAQPLGVKWANPAAAAAVTSVFTRTGDIVQLTGDYSAAQVTNAVDSTQAYANPTWITSLAWTKITGAPTIFVDPTTTKGDLMVHGAAIARLPVGADNSILTADSSQALGVRWGAAPAGSPQTPWASDINAANFNLGNVKSLAIGAASQAGVPLYVTVSSAEGSALGNSSLTVTDAHTALMAGCSLTDNTAGTPPGAPWLQAFGGTTPTALILQPSGGVVGVNQKQPVYELDVRGDINCTGTFRLNGVPFTGGGSQTPWTSDIDGGGHFLEDVAGISIGTVTPGPGLRIAEVNPAILLEGPTVGDICGLEFWQAGTYRWEISVGRIATGDLCLYNAVTNSVFWQITPAGNVGVGHPPSYKFDVHGDVNCEGVYRINGVPIGGVSSVFSRTGAVVAMTGDYTAAQITNAVDMSQTYADPNWLTSLSWSKITNAPATGVSTVFGRFGAVVAQPGDYDVSQITNAVAVTRNINTGTGLTGGGNLSSDRTLSVVPDTTNQQVQIQNTGVLVGMRCALNLISGANVTITATDNTANNRIDLTIASTGGTGGMVDPTTTKGDLIVRGAASTQRLGVGADGLVLTTDASQVLGVKWAPAALTAQTPWVSNIDAAHFALNNVSAIGVNEASAATTARVMIQQSSTERGLITANSSATQAASVSVQNDIATFLNVAVYGSGSASFAGLASLESNGTLIFQANSAEAMRLIAGRLLIGTTTDDGTHRLQVNGQIRSITGGYVFPDGTTQTTAAVSSALTSVFGRTGAVVAQSGDYTAAQVVNAVSIIGAYSDPPWITSLAWSKILNPPAFIVDPTQFKGDILARDSASLVRIPIGTAGQILTVDASQAAGLKWAAAPVTSVFGRTGDVVLTSSDLAAAGGVPSTRQVIAGAGLTGGGALSADITLAANVQSVFGRTGAITATAGDYTAAKVTNAVDSTQTYADPAWITSLAWSKITGVPAGQGQTPWVSNINAAGYSLNSVNTILVQTAAGTLTSINVQQNAAGSSAALSGWNQAAGGFAGVTFTNDQNDQMAVGVCGSTFNGYYYNPRVAVISASVDVAFVNGASRENMRVTKTGRVGIATATPGYTLDVNGDINISGTYRVNGVPLATGGGAQTPWTSNIDAAGYQLGNASQISVNVQASAASVRGIINSQYSTDAAGALYIGQKARGTMAAPAVVTTGDYTGVLLGAGYDGSSFVQSAGIGARVNGTVATGSVPTDLVFLAGTGAPLTERMRITSAGLVGIATSTPNAPLTIGGTRPAILLDSGATAGRGRVAQFVPNHCLYLTANCYYDGTAWQRDDTANSSMLFELDASNGPFPNVFNIGYCAAGTGAIGAWQRPFYFDAANTRFGIGTTSPSSSLTIAGNSGMASEVRDGGWTVWRPSGNNWDFEARCVANTGGYALQFGSASFAQTPLALTNVPQVGIGTINPQSTLDVVGNIRMSGTRSVLFYHGDTNAHMGGIQIVGLGDNNPILTPTDNTGAPVNAMVKLGGFGAFNSNVVSLAVSGNIGIQNSGPTAYLHINAASFSAPAAGVQNGGIYYADSASAWGLQIGHLSSGNCWLQAQRSDGNGALYQLQLNPLGGGVSINTASNWGNVSIAGPAYFYQTNSSSSTSTHIVLREQTVNPQYGFYIGYIAYGAWTGSIQVITGNAGGPLALNPSGGNVGIGNTTAPAYQADIHGFSTATSQLHVSYDNSDNGFYLYVGTGGGSVLTSGVAYVGGQWIAKSAGLSAHSISNDGNQYFYVGTGYTAGNAITFPTAAMWLNPSGYLSINGAGGQPWTALDVDGVMRVGRSSRNNLAASATWCGLEMWCNGASGAPSYIRPTDRANNPSSPAFPMLYLVGMQVCLGIDTTTKVMVQGTGGASYSLHLNADSAGKPATSTWQVISDARLKRNIEPVADDSLSMLEALNWIRYEYNGLYQVPEGLKGIGLLAHELREVMPEAVGTCIAQKYPVTPDEETGITRTVNGLKQEEDEVLDISYHHIIVHSARAIAQLSKRVKELEELLQKARNN